MTSTKTSDNMVRKPNFMKRRLGFALLYYTQEADCLSVLCIRKQIAFLYDRNEANCRHRAKGGDTIGGDQERQNMPHKH